MSVAEHLKYTQHTIIRENNMGKEKPRVIKNQNPFEFLMSTNLFVIRQFESNGKLTTEAFDKFNNLVTIESMGHAVI